MARADDDVYDDAVAYLEAAGVDVPSALAAAANALDAKVWDARAEADRATELTFALRKAERALAFERRGLADAAAGFTAAGVAAARERVEYLTAELGEALTNDKKLIAAARRRAEY